MAPGLDGTSISDTSETEESDEMSDETGESSAAEGGDALHGAEDPAEFRRNYEDEYSEPTSEARSVEPFQDPQENVDRINPKYNPEGSNEYNTNCADCARCYEATWRGQEQEAAGIRNCEGESPERMEQWANEEWSDTDPSQLKAALEKGGPGSSAVIGSHWQDGGHAYNVVNHEGTIETVDSQSHEVLDYSDQSIHPELEGAEDLEHQAMVWDADGRRIL